MAGKHPPRPYEDEKRVNERPRASTERAHPATPYSTGNGGAEKGPYSSYSRHGRSHSLGPIEDLPVRSPEMDEGTVAPAGRRTGMLRRGRGEED